MLKATDTHTVSQSTIEAAANLHRFIEQIDDFVRQDQASRTYPIGSRYFLDMVRKLGEQSRRYLQEGVLDASSSDQDRLNHVAILRRAWRNLHPFLQPVADAHSLRVPIPLISLITKDVRKITGVDDTLLPTQVIDDLNYLQRRQTYLRSILENIRTMLRQYNPDPLIGAFGVIGLPYSQGSSLFLNCALYHEAGHFVFEQNRLYRKLFCILAPSLQKQEPAISDVDSLASSEQLEARFKVIRPWCEELFCDLFALRMIGPVFTYALADILNLSSEQRHPQGHLFSETHPARYLRMREQISLLKELKWWKTLIKCVPHFTQHETACSAAENNTEVYSSRLRDRKLNPSYVTDVLFPVLPKIQQMASKATEGYGANYLEFVAIRKDVFECLSHRIVPSFLTNSDPTSWAKSLINAAWLFYTAKLGNVFNYTTVHHRDSARDQSAVRQRVEEWTLKAIASVVPEPKAKK